MKVVILTQGFAGIALSGVINALTTKIVMNAILGFTQMEALVIIVVIIAKLVSLVQSVQLAMMGTT